MRGLKFKRKKERNMWEKFLGIFFTKVNRKKTATIISGNRQIKTAVCFCGKSAAGGVYREEFWDNRGKEFGRIFTAINGRFC